MKMTKKVENLVIEQVKIRVSMAHKCRKCLLDHLIAPVSYSSPAAKIGTIIHQGFIPHYEQIIHEKIVYHEKALENEYFTGHIDGYIKKDKAIYELKTVNGWKFQAIKEPIDAHITQVNIYMKLMSVEKAHIVYLNRDTREHKSFDVEFNPLIYKAVEDKAKEVIEAYKKGLSPDDLELDEFEFCDEYCKFQTQTLYAKPEDEKESSEIEEKEKLLRAYEKRVALSREIAELNKQKKEAEEQIKKIMSKENARKIIDLGISFVESNRATFETKKFKEEYPELYSKFTKTTTTQSLRFKRGE
jgi:predicted phage-related endonuclease